MPRPVKIARPRYDQASFLTAAEEIQAEGDLGEEGATFLRDLLIQAAAWVALGERTLKHLADNVRTTQRRRRRAKEERVQALQQ